jgi:hypothetical protein
LLSILNKAGYLPESVPWLSSQSATDNCGPPIIGASGIRYYQVSVSKPAIIQNLLECPFRTWVGPEEALEATRPSPRQQGGCNINILVMNREPSQGAKEINRRYA